MAIQQYLLENHLKPLFIFKFNNEKSECCFGVFVGSKGGKPFGDESFSTTDLTWNGNVGNIPKWANETPLWIVPLIVENDKYDLDYDNSIELPKDIRSCFISVVNQPGRADWTDWTHYNPFIVNTSINFSHFLNFEAKAFGCELTRHEISTKNKSQNISVWLSDANNIKTSDRLITFGGIECDIVDENGAKNNFDIWCGIRDKKDDLENQNKITLSVNSENIKASSQSVGTDCPIVWRQRGILDDTIFPVGKNNYNVQSANNFLLNCRNFAATNDISKIISDVVGLNYKPAPNEYYSWFIKELNQDKKIILSPFFRLIKGGEKHKYKFNKKQLGSYISFSQFNELNFFQVNRLVETSCIKSIISWPTGFFKDSVFQDCIKKQAVSLSNSSKSRQQSITPNFKKLGHTHEQQLLLESSITENRVALVNHKFFDSNNKVISNSVSTNQSLKLPNFRPDSFSREKLLLKDNNDFSSELDLGSYFNIDFQFTTDGIERKIDNGSLLGLNIISTAQEKESKLEESLIYDGSFGFTLDKDKISVDIPTYKRTIKIEGKIYFTLQLQKAQKPFYLWEWHEALESGDTIVPCYSIEDFKLPVCKVIPLSTDLSEQERYIADDDNSSLASTGTVRPTPPLIIPLSALTTTQKYYLSLSENINVGQDYNLSAELIRGEDYDSKDNSEQTSLEVVVLGHQPQTALKIKTPFGTSPQYDNGKWVIARKNNLSADGAIWEILNETANDKGITITFSSQVTGEAFRKTDEDIEPKVIDGEPIDDTLVKFKFSTPAILQIANEQLNRQMVTAPWNIQHLFGTYGDSNPGLRLLKAEFELLYGMSANFENKDAFIAELENKLGQAVKAPRGKIAWPSNKNQNEAFEKAYSDFIKMLMLLNSRLAIYEVSTADKFKPGKFTEGINYFFRVDEKNGAKLKWPFRDKVPKYLEAAKKYHREDGLAGGFHFGFESRAIYKELWETGYKDGSSSGEIENLAFSSVGGYGKQVARFANDKTIIKSITSLGRTHFYAVERIGRISVFWNKAKHVIEYERTVVPSAQFKGTKNVGRLVVRKVREFVEILEPERKYPEFGAEPSSTGSILGSHFKSIKILVSSSWGTDIVRNDNPIGWEVPLWDLNANRNIYPFPQIMLSVMASKQSQLNEVLCNLANPENLYFYTDVRDEVDKIKITAHTDQWPSVINVDYTLQPFKNIYLGVSPCVNHNDNKLVNTPLPSPLDVLPGFERYTFTIVPSDVPISANGAYNKDSDVVGKLRTVTMQRKPTVKTDDEGNPKLYISQAQKQHLDNFHEFLNENVNGYTTILEDSLKLKSIDGVKESVVKHLAALASKDLSSFKEITSKINPLPELRYLNGSVPNSIDYNLVSFNTKRKSDWEIPTVALWFQLTKELDAGIGAVDKNYTLMFKVVQEELNQLILEVKIEELNAIILQSISDFKGSITDIKSLVEINLNQFRKQIEEEPQKIKDYLENLYSDISTEVFQLIENTKNEIGNITGITLDQFTATVKDEILKKVDESLEKIVKNLNVNEQIKGFITDKVVKTFNEEIKAKITEFLSQIDNTIPFDLNAAKTALDGVITAGENSLKSKLKDLSNDFATIITKTKAEIETVTNSLTNITATFSIILDQLYNLATEKIKNELEDKIETLPSSKTIQSVVDDFFKKDSNEKDRYEKIVLIINELTINIQAFLIDPNYNTTVQIRPVPPLANLFNQADLWIKGQIKDFKSFLNKLGGAIDSPELKKLIERNYETLKSIYKEFSRIEAAIKDGNPDAIIKEANELSQAINKDFGQAIGEVTNGYYNAVNLNNSITDFDNELKTTLFNYRSVFEEIKAVDLGFNRKTVELIYNFDKNIGPRLLLTPVMGKLQKLNDSLSTMGVSLPYAGLEDRLIAPLKEWGTNFSESFSDKFPIGNVLNNMSGIDFNNLLPFLKADDAFFKAVKISNKVDKTAMKAWVQADVDYTFLSDNTFMDIGPVSVTMLRNARITAQAYESMDIDSNRKSENFGSLKATFAISLAGTPLMLFKETVISFKNGKYDFDLDPSRMEMPGLLKILSDASQKIQTIVPQDDKEASPFKLEILKVHQDIAGKSFEMPVGVKASLDIPPLSVGGGTTSMSNLSFGGNFLMRAVDDSKPLKLDFLVGLGFYFGKRELPFNFTAFIFGGGGYIDCNLKYRPSQSSGIAVDFRMSVHASAAFSLSAGWISGSIMIFAGIEVEYKNSSGGGTRIEIFIDIMGVVDILGLVTVYLSLRLAVNYLSSGSGTVLYGTGTVQLKIKICSFVTIKVNRSHTIVLQGESKSVSNSRSEQISTSLN